jgi:putative membrane protein
MFKNFATLGLALATGITMTTMVAAAAPSATDTMFMKKAAVAGEKEVADAKAHTSDSNASVKYFAERMIRDHTKANDQLMALAQKDGVTLPPVPGPDPMMSGSQYMHAQLAAHEQAVALFKKEAQDGSGAAKTFAMNTLPTLEQHLAMAQQFAKTGRISQSSM